MIFHHIFFSAPKYVHLIYMFSSELQTWITTFTVFINETLFRFIMCKHHSLMSVFICVFECPGLTEIGFIIKSLMKTFYKVCTFLCVDMFYSTIVINNVFNFVCWIVSKNRHNNFVVKSLCKNLNMMKVTSWQEGLTFETGEIQKEKKSCLLFC